MPFEVLGPFHKRYWFCVRHCLHLRVHTFLHLVTAVALEIKVLKKCRLRSKTISSIGCFFLFKAHNILQSWLQIIKRNARMSSTKLPTLTKTIIIYLYRRDYIKLLLCVEAYFLYTFCFLFGSYIALPHRHEQYICILYRLQ